jgi:hypothetical protein
MKGGEGNADNVLAVRWCSPVGNSAVSGRRIADRRRLWAPHPVNRSTPRTRSPQCEILPFPGSRGFLIAHSNELNHPDGQRLSALAVACAAAVAFLNPAQPLAGSQKAAFEQNCSFLCETWSRRDTFTLNRKVRKVHPIAVLALVLCMVSVQTIGAVDQHEDNHGSPHHQCCPICQAGQMAALQTAVATLDAPARTEWRDPVHPKPRLTQPAPIYSPSRAPPA